MINTYQLTPIKRIVLCTILCCFCQIWGTLETSIRGALLGGIIALFIPRALYDCEEEPPALWHTLFFGLTLGVCAGALLWFSEPILQLANRSKQLGFHTKGSYTIVVAAAYGLTIHLALFIGIHKKLSKQQLFFLVCLGSALSFGFRNFSSFFSMAFTGFFHTSLFAIFWSLAILFGSKNMVTPQKQLPKIKIFIRHWLPLLLIMILIALSFLRSTMQ